MVKKFKNRMEFMALGTNEFIKNLTTDAYKYFDGIPQKR